MEGVSSRGAGDRGLSVGPSSAPKQLPKSLFTSGPHFHPSPASLSAVVLSTQSCSFVLFCLFLNGEVLLTSSGSDSACWGSFWCVCALGVGCLMGGHGCPGHCNSSSSEGPGAWALISDLLTRGREVGPFPLQRVRGDIYRQPWGLGGRGRAVGGRQRVQVFSLTPGLCSLTVAWPHHGVM